MIRSVIIHAPRGTVSTGTAIDLAQAFGLSEIITGESLAAYRLPVCGALIITPDETAALIASEQGFRALSLPEAIREAGITETPTNADESGSVCGRPGCVACGVTAGGFMSEDVPPFVPNHPAPRAILTAPAILDAARGHLESRAALRDQAGGERSMARTVTAFNAITGHALSERDGWLFMATLKATRAATTAKGIPDDYQDGAAYFALAGESAA